MQGGLAIELGGDVAMGGEGLDLRAVVERIARGIDVNKERPNAKAVPDEEEFVLFDIVERKGELAAEVLGEGDAVFPIEADGDLGIRFRPEARALGHERGAVALEVVELAVGGQDVLAVEGLDGLLAAFEVIDGEAGMAEGDAFCRIDKETLGIRSAMADGLQHRAELTVRVIGEGFGGEESGDAAHEE